MSAEIEGIALIDTNILIYALYQDKDGEKYNIASNLLLSLGRSKKGVLSIQTLAEAFWVMVSKRKPPLAPELAQQILTDYAETWRILEPTKYTFLKALEGVTRHKMSFWDAMQWALAVEYGAVTLLTEDFTHGLTVEGVKFVNPFKG